MNRVLTQLVASLKALNWDQFDPRFAPIFVVYGALAGALMFSQLGWGGIAGGVGGALLGGYLLPLRGLGSFDQGPVVNQISIGVISGMLGVAVAAFFVLR